MTIRTLRLVAVAVATALSAACGGASSGDRGVDSTSHIITIESVLPAEASGALRLQDGAVDVPYRVPLIARGGVAPYVWSLAGGALPAGLSLNPHGWVEGTPRDAITSALIVQVRDSDGGTAVAGVTVSFTLGGSSPYILPLTARAYVSAAESDLPHAYDLLLLSSMPGNVCYPYVSWDASQVPATARVVGARLRARVLSALSQPLTLRAFTIDDALMPATLTWNNAPQPILLVGESALPSGTTRVDLPLDPDHLGQFVGDAGAGWRGVRLESGTRDALVQIATGGLDAFVWYDLALQP